MIRSFITSIFAVVLLFTTFPASAAPYVHNGSVVDFQWTGGGRFEVRYSRPRSGLPVRRGTLLIKGVAYNDGSMEATAYVFKSGCRPAGYPVFGYETPNGFHLEGMAPSMNSRCQVTGYSWNHNAYLDFHVP